MLISHQQRDEPPKRGPGRIPTRSAEDFLDAARLEFAQRGARDVTMEEIAARANSTKPTLYKHFPSKDALLHATLERESAQVKAHLFAAFESAAGLPLADQLGVCVRAFNDYAIAAPDGFALLFGAAANQGAVDARDELIEAMATQLTTLVRRFGADHGIAMGLSANLMSRILIAVAVHSTQHAMLVADLDPAQSSEMAIAFSDAAIRNMDVNVLAQIDRDSAVGGEQPAA